jgi:hypothetical protein
MLLAEKAAFLLNKIHEMYAKALEIAIFRAV